MGAERSPRSSNRGALLYPCWEFFHRLARKPPQADLVHPFPLQTRGTGPSRFSAASLLFLSRIGV